MPGKNSSVSLLVLMAKRPVPGETKTRLTPPLSGQEAAELYDAFLQDKVAQMRRVSGVTCAIAYYPPDSRAYFSILAPDFILIRQQGNMLAERLANVVIGAFSEGYGKVMAIDGDTPHLPTEYLQSGILTLEGNSKDIVIGPSEDGGYYAVGLKQPHRALFNVEMSTAHVSRDTMAQAEEAGLTVQLLPEWWDIDELPDLRRLRGWLGKGEHPDGCVPAATQKFLSALPDY